MGCLGLTHALWENMQKYQAFGSVVTCKGTEQVGYRALRKAAVICGCANERWGTLRRVCSCVLLIHILIGHSGQREERNLNITCMLHSCRGRNHDRMLSPYIYLAFFTPGGGQT